MRNQISCYGIGGLVECLIGICTSGIGHGDGVGTGLHLTVEKGYPRLGGVIVQSLALRQRQQLLLFLRRNHRHVSQAVANSHVLGCVDKSMCQSVYVHLIVYSTIVFNEQHVSVTIGID